MTVRFLRYTIFGLLLSLAVAVSHSAVAQDAEFIGEWQQISSNAGNCPTCRITISETSGTITVRASNGWSATVHPVSAKMLRGEGRWAVTMGQSRFLIQLTLRDQRIFMVMGFVPGEKRKGTIQAVFGRTWLGA